MNTKARNATLFGIAAGLILVPIARAVYKKYAKRGGSADAFPGAPPNNLFSAYRGKFKPHRRKSAHNGTH